MLERIMELKVLLYVMTALGAAGAVGMLAVHLSYRRAMRRTKAAPGLKEKWLNLWKTRDRLLNRMNLLVWAPSLLSGAGLLLALFWSTRLGLEEGLSFSYVYVGAAVPLILLILRQALDFAYREELVMNSLADYILEAGAKNGRKAEPPAARRFASEGEVLPKKSGALNKEAEDKRKAENEAIREETVERITASIRQTAATGSHFSKMLKPEEEEILREIIREFMD